MDDAELSKLNFAAVAQEAAAMSDAALAGDMDEARFRALMLAAKAEVAGFVGVESAVAALIQTLGKAGGPPGVGFGAGMINVAEAIEAEAQTLRTDATRSSL
jgi:hypothetical protein